MGSLITNIWTGGKSRHRKRHIQIFEKMVFQSDPIENENEDEQTRRRMMIKTAKNGNAVVKVVNRVEEADESGILDLSDCSLNITSLDVSTNRLSSLPKELSQCTQLSSVDISSNNFVEIPSVLMEIETVTDINAKNNFIAEVNDNELETCNSLEIINLEGNPLSTRCRERIQRVSRIRVIISDKKLEEWEDLSI